MISEILGRSDLESELERLRRQYVEDYKPIKILVSHLALLDENERMREQLAFWMKLCEDGLLEVDKKYFEEHPTDFSFLKAPRKDRSGDNS